MMVGVDTIIIRGNGNVIVGESKAVKWTNMVSKGGCKKVGLVLQGTYGIKFLIAAQTML